MAGANATLPATLGALQSELLLNSLPGATDVNTGKLAEWLLKGHRRLPPPAASRRYRLRRISLP